MLFDNGHFRSKDPAKRILNKDNFSRGVRYRIETEQMTIEQVWQYGKERGAEFFSPYICNVEYYDEGHYLVHSGGIGYEDGETCEGMAVIKCMNPDGHEYRFNSITCELVDDELKYSCKCRPTATARKSCPSITLTRCWNWARASCWAPLRRQRCLL